MSLPLSLEIVATDESHFEPGGEGAAISACRPVANDSPILGRPLALPASNLLTLSKPVLVVVFVPVVVLRIFWTTPVANT